MELLLVNYKNIHKAYKIDCAEKQRFSKLITDLEKRMSEQWNIQIYKEVQ